MCRGLVFLLSLGLSDEISSSFFLPRRRRRRGRGVNLTSFFLQRPSLVVFAFVLSDFSEVSSGRQLVCCVNLQGDRPGESSRS